MKISVILPTYKPKDYIWECLLSLKKQSFSKESYEIIIVLNGCNEPYATQISDFIQKEFQGYHIQLIQIDKGGVSNARNVGMKQAKGEYLTFIDDDDYVSESYLEKLYANCSDNSIPVSNVLAVDDETHNVIDYYISDLYQKIKDTKRCKIMRARSYMSVPWAKLIRVKDIRNKHFNENFSIGEDGLFMLSISDKIKCVQPTTDDAIYFTRYREGSAVMINKDCGKKLLNKFKLAIAYLPYLLQPWRYNFLFCLTRYAALLKA